MLISKTRPSWLASVLNSVRKTKIEAPSGRPIIGDCTSDRPTASDSERKISFGAVSGNVGEVGTAVPAPENVVVQPGGRAGGIAASKFSVKVKLRLVGLITNSKISTSPGEVGGLFVDMIVTVPGGRPASGATKKGAFPMIWSTVRVESYPTES